MATVSNILKSSKLLNENIEKLNTIFNAKVNDGSSKLLSDILETEKSRVKDRYDATNVLQNFEVISNNNRMLALKHNTGKVYNLTQTAIRQLVSKISYKKELSEIIPSTIQVAMVDNHNNYYKNKISSVNELKDSLLTIIKSLRTSDIVQILNYGISKNEVEKYQIKFQNVNGVPVIRSILDLKYKNFNNVDLIEAVQEFLDNNASDWRVVRYYSDILGDNFLLRITKKFNDKAKTVGEPVEFSLDLRNSETGLSSVSGVIGLYVLKCTNGMVGLGDGDKFELIHNRNDKNTFKEALKKLLDEGQITWRNLQEKYHSSKSIVIPNAESLINSVCKDYSLGKEVSQKILNTFKRDLNTDGVSNLYKVVDSITETAHRNYKINQQGFKTLEKIGSELLFHHESFLEKYNLN